MSRTPGNLWLDVIGGGVIGAALALLGSVYYCHQQMEFDLFYFIGLRTTLGGMVAGAGAAVCYWMFTGRLR